jgi:hypothetical protein
LPVQQQRRPAPSREPKATFAATSSTVGSFTPGAFIVTLPRWTDSAVVRGSPRGDGQLAAPSRERKVPTRRVDLVQLRA